MTQVSNNLIAGLLVVAIVISGFGLLTVANMGRQVAITGGATTGVGAANVSITGAVSIELIPGRTAIDFDAGTLDGVARTIATTTVNYGTFDDGSEGNGTDQTGCSNTEATCAYPLVVRNIGNVNVSLNITASKTAASFIGGASGQLQEFLGKENESATCGKDWTGGGGFGEGTYTTLTTSETVVCTSMDFIPAANEIRLHLRLTIPADAVGTKAETITLGAITA
jgi:hypothetical protein